MARPGPCHGKPAVSLSRQNCQNPPPSRGASTSKFPFVPLAPCRSKPPLRDIAHPPFYVAPGHAHGLGRVTLTATSHLDFIQAPMPGRRCHPSRRKPPRRRAGGCAVRAHGGALPPGPPTLKLNFQSTEESAVASRDQKLADIISAQEQIFLRRQPGAARMAARARRPPPPRLTSPSPLTIPPPLC